MADKALESLVELLRQLKQLQPIISAQIAKSFSAMTDEQKDELIELLEMAQELEGRVLHIIFEVVKHE